MNVDFTRLADLSCRQLKNGLQIVIN